MSLELFNQNPNMIYGIDLGTGAGEYISSLNMLGNNGGSSGMLDSPGGLGGIGAGINGIANLVGGIGGIVNARKQLKEQKRAIDLMQNQYNIENQRYNERMAIHDKAANAINDSADYFNRD